MIAAWNVTGKKFEPSSIRGSTKYGGQGSCGRRMFANTNLPESVKEKLAEWGNHGIANSTWSTYKTAERLLLMCQAESKTKFEWPLEKDSILLFIHWLVEVRGVKEGTINSYLSGVRQLHIIKGMEVPNLRPEIVKLILQGRKNIDMARNRDMGEQRIPMTVDLMIVLKEKIRTWDQTWDTRLLVWAVCALAFHGAFRIHELLCKSESFFDPQYTLLVEHVTTSHDKDGKGIIHVTLNCPKEQKNGKVVIVDIFEAGNNICAYKAFTRWASRQVLVPGAPLFRLADGTPLTGKRLNTILRNLMTHSLGNRAGKVRTHCFRIGLASELGTAGFEDGEVQVAGRWSSRAFELYMKNPRTKRASIAKKIAELGSKKGKRKKGGL